MGPTPPRFKIPGKGRSISYQPSYKNGCPCPCPRMSRISGSTHGLGVYHRAVWSMLQSRAPSLVYLAELPDYEHSAIGCVLEIAHNTLNDPILRPIPIGKRRIKRNRIRKRKIYRENKKANIKDEHDQGQNHDNGARPISQSCWDGGISGIR